MSDITSADGRTILPNYIKGLTSLDRISTLKWPTQSRPPISAWKLWRRALSHLSTNETLPQRLGQWTNVPNQLWTCFQYSSQHLVYQLSLENNWLEYYLAVPTTGSTRTTRETKVWYSLSATHTSNPDTSLLLPATIYQDPFLTINCFIHLIAITPYILSHRRLNQPQYGTSTTPFIYWWIHPNFISVY